MTRRLIVLAITLALTGATSTQSPAATPNNLASKEAAAPAMPADIPNASTNPEAWMQVGIDRKGNKNLVDRGTWLHDASTNTVWYWNRTEYAVPPAPQLGTTEAYYSAQCNTGVTQVWRMVQFSPDGQMLKAFNTPPNQQQVKSGSVGLMAVAAVCGNSGS